MDFIYVSCTMCSFIVKLTWQQFHTIFLNNFVHRTHFHRVGLSTSGGLLVLKVSGIGVLLTLGLWVREVQPVWSSPGKSTVSEDTPCPSPLRHGQVRGTKASLAFKWGHWRLPEPSWSPHYTDCLPLCYLAVKEHTRKDKLKLHNLGKSVTRLLVANCTLAVH